MRYVEVRQEFYFGFLLIYFKIRLNRFLGSNKYVKTFWFLYSCTRRKVHKSQKQFICSDNEILVDSKENHDDFKKIETQLKSYLNFIRRPRMCSSQASQNVFKVMRATFC